MNWIRVDEILDVLLPPECLLCAARIPRAPLCAACEADLPWLGRCCPRCGLPLRGTDGGPCGACSPPLLALNAVAAALPWEYPVDRLISAAKFGRQLPVARALGQMLALRMPLLLQPPDLVVPVPLHWRRQAERGFNQAAEIARGLCRWRRWPLATEVCRRLRPTDAQSGLSAADRQANLRHAFTARPLPAGSRVLVIDDVLTTGATAAAVAGALRAAGARQVCLWTVARVLPGAKGPPAVPVPAPR